MLCGSCSSFNGAGDQRGLQQLAAGSLPETPGPSVVRHLYEFLLCGTMVSLARARARLLLRIGFPKILDELVHQAVDHAARLAKAGLIVSAHVTGIPRLCLAEPQSGVPRRDKVLQ